MKHIFKLLFNSKSLGVLTLALMLPLSLNLAEAAKPCITDPTHQSCKDDGGDQSNFVQTMTKNWMIWGSDGGSGPYEVSYDSYPNGPAGTIEPRFCDGDDLAVLHPNTQGYVAYVCHQDRDFLYGRDPNPDDELANPWNVVFLDLSFLNVCDEDDISCDGMLVADGRDDFLCKRLTNEDDPDPYFPVLIVPKRETDWEKCVGGHPDPNCGIDDPDPENVGRNTSYYITLHESNDEPCIDGSNRENSCKVVIPLRGYFDEECSGNKCGRLIGLQAWGHVDAAPAPGNPAPAPGNQEEPIEINPFTRSQFINIEELSVYFRGIGTNRTVANCYYDNRQRDGSGNIKFDDDGNFIPLKPIVFRTCVVPEGGTSPVCLEEPRDVPQ